MQFPTQPASIEEALALARSERPQAEKDLCEELRIPSISTRPEFRGEVERNAAWLTNRLKGLGFEVETPVFEGGHPVISAAIAGPDRAPVVAIYGHYDVQPPEPLEPWTSGPFEPTVRDGVLFARGAADSKGNHMAALKAVEYVIRTGRPPVGIRFLIEGEEESAGTSLGRFLRQNSSRLPTDVVLLWDGAFSVDGRPSLSTSLRGVVFVEILAHGSARDVHSGAFGGVAPNPLQTLVRALAGLKSSEGRILLDGFYADVPEPTAEEVADWPTGPDHSRRLLSLIGCEALEGESDYPPVVRQWARPSMDINGLWGGFTGDGIMTVIPNRAGAKVSMRLVAGQNPEDVTSSLERYLHEYESPSVKLELRVLAAVPPTKFGVDHRGARAMRRAYSDTFGVPGALKRGAGSLPVALDLQRLLGADIVYSGISRHDCAAHAPDERLRLSDYHLGTEALIRFLFYVADMYDFKPEQLKHE